MRRLPVPFPFLEHDGRSYRSAIQGRSGLRGEPSASVRRLQLRERDEIPGTVHFNTGKGRDEMTLNRHP